MDSQPVNLPLTKEQFGKLLHLVMLGAQVETSARDARSEPHGDIHDMESFLLSYAAEFGLGSSAIKEAGKFAPSSKLQREIKRTMREYDDDMFWWKLESELGLRDFYETLDFKEIRAIKEGQTPMPEKVHEFYEKYASEFDRHRAERLRIVE